MKTNIFSTASYCNVFLEMRLVTVYHGFADFLDRRTNYKFLVWSDTFKLIGAKLT